MVLEQEVWSEERILELLKIDKSQLARLVREKNFPVIRLGNSCVFLADSVLKWIKEHETSGKWEGRGRKPKEK
jgi:predicted DNA-binding transcriptional regulator AlpA